LGLAPSSGPFPAAGNGEHGSIPAPLSARGVNPEQAEGWEEERDPGSPEADPTGSGTPSLRGRV